MTAASLWTRLAVLWALGAVLLVMSAPTPPRPPWAAPTGGLVGLSAGIALFLALGGRPPLGVPRAATAAILVLSAGAEEVAWRWFGLAELAALAGVPAALAASSLGFALAHPGARGTHLATGAVFGSVYVVTGGLVGPWVAHASYNLLATAAR